MNAVAVPEYKSTESTGRLLAFSSRSSTEQVQTTIGQLQEEVQRLQAQLVQTRRELEQRITLLRNSQSRERELRSEVGAR